VSDIVKLILEVLVTRAKVHGAISVNNC